jgi:hypothetical protein
MTSKNELTHQGDQIIRKKTFAQVFGKSSQNSGQAKKMPKYIHQITFETLKQLLYSGYPLKLLTLLKI